MALWLNRAGSRGQFEEKFLLENRIYLTWKLDTDLAACSTRQDLSRVLNRAFPDFKPGKLRQHGGQIWAFVHKMKIGDWVALPSKQAPTIHIGEISGKYEFDSSTEKNFHHFREVKWIENDIPRSNFDQDILYSLGAFMTVCEIKRNDAEKRVRSMAASGWRATKILNQVPSGSSDTDTDEEDATDKDPVPNLEEAAREAIASQIIAKYKGHGLARLARAILEAQGFSVHQPGEGPDHGIDLLASPGGLGFGSPRICVQVKSQEHPLDRPALDQLRGTMENVGAEKGLLICWGGFKRTVTNEEGKLFFKVRLWDRDDLIENLLDVYERLSSDIQAELPLKQVWTLAIPEEDEGE